MLVPRLLDSDAAKSADIDPAHTLALVRYGAGRGPGALDYVTIDVPLESLGTAYEEIWASERRVERGELAGVRLAHDGEYLLGVLSLAEAPDAAGFESEVASAYARISRAAVSSAFPHLLRIWNYLPDIHQSEAGLNRYQRFCRARFAPLTAHCRAHGDGYPAATAIGTFEDRPLIYFLAAKRPGRHLENPRQESAYRYPECYGPQSPSFARATMSEIDSRGWLFVSGTASIVGHESRHRENVVAQCREVLENIDQLLKTTQANRGIEALTHVKVYLRNTSDLDPVCKVLGETAIGPLPREVLRGELCRSELLLEIEGLAIR